MIPDDEIHLAQFSTDPAILGTWVKLWSPAGDVLPLAKEERKKVKPDFEAITLLPPSLIGAPRFLVTPSGSKSNRHLGAIVFLSSGLHSAHADVHADSHVIRQVDFSELFAEFRRRLPELNIEGTAVSGNTLKFFNRGNSGVGRNAIIDVELAGFLTAAEQGAKPPASLVKSVRFYDLGQLRGVPLGFTDACTSSSGELWALAAAEMTSDAYRDGPYLGAALMRFDTNGDIAIQQTLECPEKPEGLWITPQAGSREFFVVTDNDDTARPSHLYVGSLPAGTP